MCRKFSAEYATNNHAVNMNQNNGNGSSTNDAATRGTINLSGGTLQFGTLSKFNGTADFNWSAGTIQNLPTQNLTDTNVPLDLLCTGTGDEVRQYCRLDGAGESLVRAAMGQMNLSARGYHCVLKLAPTIADLAGALQYRPRTMLAEAVDPPWVA